MRHFLEELEGGFESINQRSVEIIGETAFPDLVRNHEFTGSSISELVVRSAAKVEQACGGITTRLWDDPFEWTLPESFHDKEAILLYLQEVADTRARAFRLISIDSNLQKEIPAPEHLNTLSNILIEALCASSNLLHLANFLNSKTIRARSN